MSVKDRVPEQLIQADSIRGDEATAFLEGRVDSMLDRQNAQAADPGQPDHVGEIEPRGVPVIPERTPESRPLA